MTAPATPGLLLSKEKKNWIHGMIYYTTQLKIEFRSWGQSMVLFRFYSCEGKTF